MPAIAGHERMNVSATASARAHPAERVILLAYRVALAGGKVRSHVRGERECRSTAASGHCSRADLAA